MFTCCFLRGSVDVWLSRGTLPADLASVSSLKACVRIHRPRFLLIALDTNLPFDTLIIDGCGESIQLYKLNLRVSLKSAEASSDSTTEICRDTFVKLLAREFLVLFRYADHVWDENFSTYHRNFHIKDEKNLRWRKSAFKASPNQY